MCDLHALRVLCLQAASTTYAAATCVKVLAPAVHATVRRSCSANLSQKSTVACIAQCTVRVHSGAPYSFVTSSACLTAAAAVQACVSC
jgi:hypothetical protein